MTSSTPRKPIALVTGASRGIGAAIAVVFARRGIEPILAVRDPNPAASTRDAVRDAGAAGHVVRCDVADPASVAAAVDACCDLGGLDIVVNNAGQIDPIGIIADTDPAQWSRALTVNLAGPYHVVRAALPLLRESAAPCIVNISSGAAHAPREGWSAYCASKAGLAMLTRSLALEYPDVPVYGFQPGVVDTDMQGLIRASGINEVSRIPRERLAPPEQPAEFIAWIVEERPADLVGQDLSIRDEGLRARVLNGRAQA